MYVLHQSTWIFFFFVCFSRWIPDTGWEKYQYRPVFWVTLCVFKHNEGVRLSVSIDLSGGLIKRIPIERVLPMAWKERAETSWGQNLARATWGPGEDSRNEKPCLKRFAMPQTQHFEGRPKALRVENTILNKFPFPFCAPDIIKTPWISNSHLQKLHRLGKGSLSLITTQHLHAY